MEETGKISLTGPFSSGASSFSDLLDKVNMINEIAGVRQADAAEDGGGAAADCSPSADLETQMDELEKAKSDLAEQQTALETQRAESDQLILQMSAERRYSSFLGRNNQKLRKKLEDEKSPAQIKVRPRPSIFNALSKRKRRVEAELNRQNNNKVPSNGSSIPVRLPREAFVPAPRTRFRSPTHTATASTR